MKVSTRIKRNIFWKTVGESSRIFTLLFFVVVARGLGGEHFGVFSTVLAFSGIIVLISEFGLNTLLVREIAKDRGHAAEHAGQVLALKLLLSVPVVIGSIVAVWVIGFEGDLALLTGLYALVWVSRGLWECFGSIFSGLESMQHEALLKITNQVIVIAGSLMLLALRYQVVALGVLLVVTNLGTAAIGLGMVRWKTVMVVPRGNPSIWWTLLKEGFPLSLATGFSTAFLRADIILLASLSVGTIEVGWYSAAAKMIEGFGVIPFLVVGAMLPIFSQELGSKNGLLASTWNQSLRHVSVIGLVIGAGTLILAAPVVRVVFGSEYSPSVLPLRILALALPFIFLNYVLLTLAVAAGEQRQNAWGTGTALAINIVLDLALIPAYEMAGAAVAAVVAQIWLAAYMWMAVMRMRVPLTSARVGSSTRVKNQR